MTAALSVGLPVDSHLRDIVQSGRGRRRVWPVAPALRRNGTRWPPGFDFGEQSRAHSTPPLHRGRTMSLNDQCTKALIAAKKADVVLAGALANATAVADSIVGDGITTVPCLCSEEQGEISIEDTLGAGAR